MLLAWLVDSLRRQQELSGRDALTGAASRGRFVESAGLELEKARRSREPLTMGYIDLDNFKQVNDTLGHDAGDDLLRALVDIVQGSIRPSDTIGRLGGDEFALLLPETGFDDAHVVLERLRLAACRRPSEGLAGHVSVGAITFDLAPSSVESMIKRADEAMYSVKKAGKNALRHLRWPAEGSADESDDRRAARRSTSGGARVRKRPAPESAARYNQDMSLSDEVCYRAVASRDARFDGRFFTGVTTTGIYCRPVCPSRTPRREHARFFRCAAEAEAAGFRPCLRCRPETAPGSPAWSGTRATVSRALRLISGGFLDEHSVAELAGRLGLGDRHLRRLFLRHLGATPVQVAQTRRIHFARSLLSDSALSIADVAFASGFGSLRRFNAAFRESCLASPTALRSRIGRAAPAPDGTLALRLRFRPPYAWQSMLRFLAPRATPGVEAVSKASTAAASRSTARPA